MSSGCKGCPMRAPGCHGKCATYQQFREEREAVNQWLREQNDPVTVPKAKYDPVTKRYRSTKRRRRRA